MRRADLDIAHIYINGYGLSGRLIIATACGVHAICLFVAASWKCLFCDYFAKESHSRGVDIAVRLQFLCRIHYIWFGYSINEKCANSPFSYSQPDQILDTLSSPMLDPFPTRGLGRSCS